MAEVKTTRNGKSVHEFLEGISNEKRRQDGYAVLEIMKEITGLDAEMWGDSIIGFGSRHYKYASGRQGDWPLTGFSPRKQNLALYLTMRLENYSELLAKLGKHKTGVGCLYINKLEDVDMSVLKELVTKAFLENRDYA